uniref:TBC1 domain family member 10C n=1 Tax=Chelydra serpentina TaxID=8475 RepID=A0A8C3TGC0_CHESE
MGGTEAQGEEEMAFGLTPILFPSCSPGQPPVELLRHREARWLEITSYWEKAMARRYKKVKVLCRKGIPSSMRARCWPLLCGGQVSMDRNYGKYKELEQSPGDPQWLETIEKDIHRQFPFHEMFLSPEGHGQRGLLQLLKAYTVYRPREGYCQAQGPVAAVLLMHMPAEQAFWCLVQISERYLPGYYSPEMEAVLLDGEVFVALLRRVCPKAYKHLQKHGVGPLLYVTEWFLCLYSRTLPFPTVLRIWDAFLSEGVKVLFRVGLVLVRLALGSSEKLRDCTGVVETLEKLRSIPARLLQEDTFMAEVRCRVGTRLGFSCRDRNHHQPPNPYKIGTSGHPRPHRAFLPHSPAPSPTQSPWGQASPALSCLLLLPPSPTQHPRAMPPQLCPAPFFCPTPQLSSCGATPPQRCHRIIESQGWKGP